MRNRKMRPSETDPDNFALVILQFGVCPKCYQNTDHFLLSGSRIL